MELLVEGEEQKLWYQYRGHADIVLEQMSRTLSRKGVALMV